MRVIIVLSLVAFSLAARPASAQDSFGSQKPPEPQAQQPTPGVAPAVTAPAGSTDLGRLAQVERQDFGVAAKAELHGGPMHAPTPSSIPGGQVITTQGLVELMKNQQVRTLVFDILGGPEVIPGAIAAVPAAQAGSFSDKTQQEFGQFLQQMTQGNKEAPLVFYCLSNHCWMSYNASLRAINMGYKNVLWYRGGIEAWKAAGQQVHAAGRGQ